VTQEVQANTVERNGDDATRTMMLYIVRHGRTALNAAGRLRGHRNVPLDDVGRAEAAALSRLFATVPLSGIYSSPLSRAVDTANAISATTRARVAIDDRLVDRDYADWAGASRTEIEQRFGSLDDAPGVERSDAVVARVLSLVADIRAGHSGQRVLIVAHDIVNRFLLGALCNLGSGAQLAQPTGCWSLVTERDGRWTMTAVGALPGDGQVP
jgi:broad specificity phosphatase PhoE